MLPLSIGNLIILIGAVQGIFIAAILWSLKEEKTSHRLLAVFLFSFALQMFAFVAWDSHFILKVPHFSMVTSPVDFALGPLYFLYCKSLTQKDFSLKKRDALHFIPFIAGIIYFIPFYLKSAAYKIQYNLDSYDHFPDYWRRFSIAAMLQTSVYVGLIILILMRHERTVKKYYSSVEKRNLWWIRANVLAMIFGWVSCSLITFIGWKWANYYSNIIFSFCVYSLGYFGIKQRLIFADIREEITTEESEPAVIKPQEMVAKKYEKSGLSEEKAKALLSALDDLMQKEKLYLDPELNLQQLADRLHISLHHLSQVLNQYKQQNFFDYVNQLRVEEFKREVFNPSKQHLSLLGIALECGFNSKAAFNAAFKKFTGTTPSAFKKVSPLQNA